MNQPLSTNDPYFDELWNKTHGGTGDPEYGDVVEIEADADEMDEDCFDDKDEY